MARREWNYGFNILAILPCWFLELHPRDDKGDREFLEGISKRSTSGFNVMKRHLRSHNRRARMFRHSP
jgi:hypothetical protein